MLTPDSACGRGLGCEPPNPAFLLDSRGGYKTSVVTQWRMEDARGSRTLGGVSWLPGGASAVI